MPQIFNIVKCYQCNMYQVDIDKKSTNKWTCKLCGSKQSLKQIFFQGESKDCRLKVQQLNEMGSKIQEQIAETKLNYLENQTNQQQHQNSYENNSNVSYQQQNILSNATKVSKWARFLTNDSDDDN
ncbi:unnamed protein product [Brachionus calyciflorus]|uniref:MRN complex-interacting protein N-terminal domain-containing protein n=1 Tax=Brachionus calyciflorus TaxID=104777 RepID=A0A813QED7_9BILA|nr:unnamed protein product [Brachionus calyciflorus]